MAIKTGFSRLFPAHPKIVLVGMGKPTKSCLDGHEKAY
jgi:hypothetical protein